MKAMLRLVIFILFCAYAQISLGQLPPVAQALYDEAVVQDSAIVQYALNHNAGINATADGNSFYIQWFPGNLSPASYPLIVSLHGSGGYAFHEFFNWHQLAQQYGCGIIALQWYRGNSASPPNDYFNENAIYEYVDSALTAISYPSGKAFLHGFSRGAARSYAIIFKDIQSGNNYFCTTLSNAGGADLSYPLYHDIDTGAYGANVFSGKRWALFCGGQDSNPAQSGCIAMNNTQSWLQSQGATVDLFIQDPVMQHDGFQQQSPPVYRDSVLNYYLQCYNGTLSTSEKEKHAAPAAFPNPAKTSVSIEFGQCLNNVELVLFDSYGRKIKTISNYSGSQLSLSVECFANGVYLLSVTGKNKETTFLKFVVTH